MGNPQRLNDTEQLEILGLLESVSTDPLAMRAARPGLVDVARRCQSLHIEDASDRWPAGIGAKPQSGLICLYWHL